jgi:hypothetical protein
MVAFATGGSGMRDTVQKCVRDRLAWTALIVGLIGLLPTVTPFLPPDTVLSFNNKFSDPIMIVAVLACLVAGWRRSPSSSERRFWLLWAGAYSVFLVVRLIAVSVPGEARGTPLSLLFNLLFVSFYVFATMALSKATSRI